MIDAKTGIAGPPVSLVIPERVHRCFRMQCANGVDPALIEKSSKQRSRLGLHKGILGIGLGRVDVGISRHDVIVARQYDRRIECIKLSRVRQQPFHPVELVRFWTRLWVAVWRIKRANQHTMQGRFDIASLGVGWVARELSARDDGLDVAREDGDAIP